MTRISLKGSCLCGAVRYEVTGEPVRFHHCHCSRCRKATGTGHATNLFLQPGALQWISGDDRVRLHKVPQAERFANQFCTDCGARLPRLIAGTDNVMIPAGSLDDPIPLAPQARIFQDSRAAWSCVGDSLPRFPNYAS
jgi:hypothetical protein